MQALNGPVQCRMRDLSAQPAVTVRPPPVRPRSSRSQVPRLLQAASWQHYLRFRQGAPWRSVVPASSHLPGGRQSWSARQAVMRGRWGSQGGAQSMTAHQHELTGVAAAAVARARDVAHAI